ncbi:MAG: hypothetical protein MJ131_10455 [Lachnospiraceae bacterium]|nr:hypothetical protein [Lachnospiraceae bacterium]
MKNLVTGTYGIKTLFSDFFSFLKKKAIQYKNAFFAFMKGHWFDYLLLAALVLFGMIYFSTAAFADRSYGIGDMYVHHAWTYDLTVGDIFSAGIYPEGMHCFLACENMLFGVDIQSLYLFTAGIQAAIILVSLMVMLRELFTWKYSPYLVLILFLTVDVKEQYAVTSFSRLQWTMPQEFGFPAMFLCVAFLIKFLRERTEAKKDLAVKSLRFVPGCFKNDSLFIFIFCLATTISCHFYTTIFTFLLCLFTVIFMPGKVFIKGFFKKIFIPVISSILFGVLIAVIPMAGAFAEGMEFQSSIGWAISIMDAAPEEEKEEPEDEAVISIGTGTVISTAEEWDAVKDAFLDIESEKEKDLTEIGKVPVKKKSVFKRLGEKISILYEQGYVELYGKTRAIVFIVASFMVLAAWIALRVIFYLRKKRYKDDTDLSRFAGYPAMVLMAVIFTAMFCAENLGIPYIIEWYRVCIFAQLGSLCLFVVPVDIAVYFLPEDAVERFGKPATVAGVVFIYALTKITGIFHGYMMFELTRYNSAVIVTKSIIDDMKANDNFTIVSTTDEYYQQMGHGYHEEIINFVNAAEAKSYSIPSEYLFIYVEKHPIRRAQRHIFTGPGWIADEKYRELYDGGEELDEHVASQCPDIYKSIIQEPLSDVFFDGFPLDASVYNTEWLRTVVMSKLYVWCQKFNQMYPNELHTYYEDDDFVCYYLIQNPRNLYELAVFNPELMIPPNKYPSPIWPKGYYDLEEEAE